MLNRRLLSAWGMSLLLLVSHMTGAIAAQHVSYEDLKQEAQGRWQESIEGQGRIIKVNVDIEMPDVNEVPAVRISFPSEDFAPRLPTTGIVKQYYDDNQGFSYSRFSKINSTIVYNDDADSIRIPGEHSLAENNPLTREDAIGILEDLASLYDDVLGKQQYWPWSVIPYTREYMVLTKDGMRVHDKDGNYTFLMDQPTTDMGHYNIVLKQCFHGIPYLQSLPPITEPQKGRHYDPPMGQVQGLIASMDDYVLMMSPAMELGVVEANLPLMNFAKVKETIKNRIIAGYIRDVYSVRFGYLAYVDTDKPGEHFILLPIWEVRGDIYSNPNNPDNTIRPADEEFVRRFFSQCELVNAQTGKLIDPKDGSAERRWANIITWNEVK
ncbi:MAG: hypothetical protein VB099_06815 [Candidatus Limiplasma sp.]|nr:hypothetical protein [Candidatus Limiplasma sp.]